MSSSNCMFMLKSLWLHPDKSLFYRYEMVALIVFCMPYAVCWCMCRAQGNICKHTVKFSLISSTFTMIKCPILFSISQNI